MVLVGWFYKPAVAPLGWGLLGWRMGIQGSVWQSCWIIHVHLTPPASIPLCSASIETSTAVWMSDLPLSPSLNLKWGASSWLSQQFLRRQRQDTAVAISPSITGAQIGLEIAWKLSHPQSPAGYCTCLFGKWNIHFWHVHLKLLDGETESPPVTRALQRRSHGYHSKAHTCCRPTQLGCKVPLSILYK